MHLVLQHECLDSVVPGRKFSAKSSQLFSICGGGCFTPAASYQALSLQVTSSLILSGLAQLQTLTKKNPQGDAPGECSSIGYGGVWAVGNDFNVGSRLRGESANHPSLTGEGVGEGVGAADRK